MAADSPSASFMDKAWPFVKRALAGFGMRIVAHLAGIITGAILASRFMDGALAYIGVICLMSRGPFNNAAWLIPTACGLTQTVVLSVFGAALPQALFWGGLQVWLQRLMAKRAALGWEWSVFPALCLGALSSYGQVAVWTVPVIATAGGAFAFLYLRLRVDPIQRAALKRSLAALLDLLKTGVLPVPLEAPLRQLANQLSLFMARGIRLDAEAAPIVRAAEDIRLRVLQLQSRSQPTSWDSKAASVLEAVAALNGDLHQRMVALGPAEDAPPPAEGTDEAQLARLDGLTRDLSLKKHRLPEPFQAHVDSVCRAADNILGCMREDAGDFVTGQKFLSRYLPAAHRVADEYIRMTAGETRPSQPLPTIDRGKELFARLETAFTAEHRRLLQNDTINLTAELNVLDKLLQMGGQ